MLGAFQAQINKLLGQSQDPLGLITPDQLKAVLKSIEGKYNALRDENKRLKATIADLKELTEHLEDDVKRYKERADQEPVRPGADPEELARLRSEYAIVQQAAESLRAELAKSQQAGDTVREELAKSQAACDAWRIELHEVRTDSSRLMDELGEATLKLESAQAELAELRHEFESTRQALQNELETARQALQSERSKVTEREEELLGFRSRAVSPVAHQLIVRERDQLRAEKAELETRIKEQAAAMDALRSELDQSRHNTQVVVATTDIKIQERMAALEQEKLTLRKQLEAAHAESDRMRRELQGAVGSAFKPQEGSSPQRPVSAEERRRLIQQLVSGQNS
ncbi:MAG TPA: hypothetical protein V6D05_12850 [Stenomitos sp.]